MEQAVAAFAAGGDALAEDETGALELHDFRLAPGRVMEVDAGCGLVSRHFIA